MPFTREELAWAAGFFDGENESNSRGRFTAHGANIPYIKAESKENIDLSGGATNAGELNYVITTTLIDYFHNNGARYQQINDVLGALEGAKLEFYRRIAVPYEDEKIKENGDVY